MKFGIMFANSGPFAEPENAVALATAAEEVGIESLWTVEHTVVPAGYESQYPYSRSGRMPGGEESAIPDPLVWLSFVAAHTSSIVLATGILILPQRNPVITAKEVATLDRLSGGRFQLGIGVGWLEEEFKVLDIPFEERGARTDDYVAAMRALWSQERPTHHGRFSDFTDAISLPQPLAGSVPIVVGGHSSASARRAGRLGDGYFPAKGDDEVLAALFDEMRTAATEAGRKADAIELTTGARRSADSIKALADLGVSRVVIPPLAFDADGIRPALEKYAETMMAEVNG